MKPASLSSTLQIFPLILAATLFGKANPALSQASNIVPDDTLGEENSQVIENFNEQPVEVITGGAQREQNLFHSFQEFNVSEGREAYFNSPNADVQNIFSRVTGSNPSEIMGVLGTFGESNPNLYLVNPNGIVFGENAALDVQGSFTATTADAIEFSEGGLFSAVAPGESLLTISVPLGLQFGSTPGSIVNRSFAQDETGENVGLQVPTGENLALVGGDINFDGGEATARGGNIYLGGLGAAGIVSFEDDGSLGFPDEMAKADVDITNFSDIDVRGTGGGSINIDARNANIEAGESNPSLIRAGIIEDSIFTEAIAGNITLAITDNLVIDGSLIANIVESEVGTGGNINIDAGSLMLTNKGIIQNSSFGQGNANNINVLTNSLLVTNGAQLLSDVRGKGNSGSILINATNFIVLDGENIDQGSTLISSSVESGADGNAGIISIDTNSLSVINGAQLLSNTKGKGNAGGISINATDFIVLNGKSSNGITTFVSSSVEPTAEGNAGSVVINTDSLSILNEAQVQSVSRGKGDAGLININASDFVRLNNKGAISSSIEPQAEGDAGDIFVAAKSLEVNNDSFISSSTFAKGNAGTVVFDVSDSIFFDNRSIVASSVQESAEGNGGDVSLTATSVAIANGTSVFASTLGKGDAGNVNIEASSLSVTSGSYINADTKGKGNAGNIAIDVSNAVIFDGEDENDISVASSIVGEEAEGNGGNISITTNFLKVSNGARLFTQSLGTGDSGNIIVDTSSIVFDGQSKDGFISGVTTSLNGTAKGKAGDIFITTDSLEVTNNALISANTFSRGDGGNIIIKAFDSILFDQAGVGASVGESAEGKAGDISITTNNFNVINDGNISAFTLGNGDAGDIVIEANSLNIANDSLINASTLANGEGGNIFIDANIISLDSNSEITTLSISREKAGNIFIYSDDTLEAKNSYISSNSIQSAGGQINITAGNIRLLGDSDIQTDVFIGADNGGNIAIEADSIVAFDDSDIFAFARDGQGGNISLNTPAFFAENFTLNSLTADPDELDFNSRADVNATGAVSGSVAIPDVSFIQNSLTELPNNSINTNELVANSCVVPVGDRSHRSQGKFIITGGESLPVRPGDNLPSRYPTGEVRGVSEDTTSSWQPGDPIIEPQGAYRLANGKMVLSRECS